MSGPRCAWGWSVHSRVTLCRQRPLPGSEFCAEHREIRLAKVRAMPPPPQSHKLRWPTGVRA